MITGPTPPSHIIGPALLAGIAAVLRQRCRLIIAVLLLAVTGLPVRAVADAVPIELTFDAPDRHIVEVGDTLWGIARRFLKDPYRWPELWRMNEAEIVNPHRIYPGQVVILDRSGEEPRLKLGEVKLAPKIHVAEIEQAISSIPPKIIEPFLAEPLVVEAEELLAAPRIVATQEARVMVGAGDTIYVSGLDGRRAERWQIYRLGRQLVDPDNDDVLGREALYLGSALLRVEGEPATLEVLDSRLEIGRGDQLLPAAKLQMVSYVPRRPNFDLRGRVVSIYGGVDEGGRYSVIVVSRGRRDGLENGHVLALYRHGGEVTNRFRGDMPETTRLPDERYGLAFVFRVFERVAYALVMEGNRSVIQGDRVRTP